MYEHLRKRSRRGAGHRKFGHLKRWLTVWVASLILVPLVFSQKGGGAGFELISYRARVQLFPEEHSLSCLDTLTLKSVNEHREEIALGLLPVFNIEYLSVNGKPTTAERRGDSIRFHEIPPDNEIHVVMKYSGALNFFSEFTRLTSERGVLNGEEIFPRCPAHLQSVRLTLVVPKGWKTVAMGRLAEVDSSRDSIAYTWICDQAVGNYGWICIGTFWDRSDTRSGISVYRMQQDSAATDSVLSLTRSALEFYGERFSPYRFPKLDVVEIEDWVAGPNVLAIAAPSFIMVKRTAFTTPDRFNQVQSILPHEIAHQWWPITVFLNEQDNAFLSEGMCDYSAYLFNESRGVLTQRDSLGRHPLLRPLLTRAVERKDLPLQGKMDLRSHPTQYLKAAYVHNMLRRIIGDTVLFRLYHEFVARFALQKVGLDDFQHLAEELSGKDLGWFFNQWVRGRGIPRLKLYNVRSSVNGSSWIVRGHVRIVGYDEYSTFADVGITTVSGMRKLRVWLGTNSSGKYRNEVTFEMTVDSQPLRAILDPESDLLKFQELPVKLSDLREPADGLFVVGSRGHRVELLSLARKDSARMENAGWSVRIAVDSTITLGDLQNERVFLYGKVSDNRVAEEQQFKFPLRFRGDSLIVDAAEVFDSSLTLMQLVESPYRSHGLIGWIVPFSEEAQPELYPFDASWVLVRGKERIASGTWEVKEKDLETEIR